MENAKPANLFGDITKMLEQFRLPGIDVAAIVESRRKDIEALMTANKMALEAAQSLGQKQVEMLRHSLTEIRAAITTATTVKDPADPAHKNADLIQRILQTVLQDLRELTETAFRSQSETAAVVNRRIQDNIEEMKVLLKPKESRPEKAVERVV